MGTNRAVFVGELVLAQKRRDLLYGSTSFDDKSDLLGFIQKHT